jgi:hypothetical protein
MCLLDDVPLADLFAKAYKPCRLHSSLALLARV